MGAYTPLAGAMVNNSASVPWAAAFGNEIDRMLIELSADKYIKDNAANLTNNATPWSVPTIYAPDPYRTQIEASSGGLLTVLYDSAGNPSIMRVIPRFRIQDVDAGTTMGTGTFPAFIVNGVAKSYLFYPVFLASQGAGGLAVSFPGRDPWNAISWDNARAACVNKGTGWHLATRWEWAAVALWSQKNGNVVRGNTAWGQAHDALWETSPRADGAEPGLASGTGRTKTGIGTAKWRHDGTFQGIADLVGNCWEWVDGMKLVAGEIYLPASRDNDVGALDSAWTATGITTALLNAGSGNNWKDIPLSAGFDALAAGTRQLAAQLMIAPKVASGNSSIYAAQGGFWFDATSERFPVCGGSWSSGALAGLAALLLNNARSVVYDSIGFRPAFIS